LWFERLTVNDKVGSVLGSIPGSSDNVESERQMKQCSVEKSTEKNLEIPLLDCQWTYKAQKEDRILAMTYENRFFLKNVL
jgi:hypothetical protein